MFGFAVGNSTLKLNASESSISSLPEEKCSQSEGPPKPKADAPVVDILDSEGSGYTGATEGGDMPEDRATLALVTGEVDSGKVGSTGGRLGGRFGI